MQAGVVNVRAQRVTVCAVGMVTAAAAVAGCATGSPPPLAEQPATVASTPAAESAAGEQPGHDDHVHALPPAPPPAAQAAPVAAEFAAAWARPDLSAQAWWEGLAPLCDEGFAALLRTVDPARVPATRVIGPPVATQAPTDGAATFEVPTDAGTVTVTLAGVDGQWVATGVDFSRAVSQS